MSKCSIESHEASKLDETLWRQHAPALPWFDGERWCESRHCHCGSTLSRPYEGLRIRRGDADHVTVMSPERVSGTASRHEFAAGTRIFVHGEASDPIEAAAMAFIAATELARASERSEKP